ncbi:Nep1-domain-containing protein [Stereum hirsutum FP-91666 SS1]|uniref:Nep1-domain-containing protein n=1 Tax=Stereum hirsutum (strain FP-91666) TaxID=721885 RepID=UPI000444A638|nr:Nep1-domain-containing protein [Stereum hirsutum FP-91666 SS1]EIM85412.1 Nep1-domain-containing protein [Stereum hirsutum FP-91666 SS1]
MSIPTQRRRHSGSATTLPPVQPSTVKAAKSIQYTTVDPIPRPKSTPVDERDKPRQRKRVYDLGSSGSSESDDEETMAVDDAPAPVPVPAAAAPDRQLPRNSTLDASTIALDTTNVARPTRPLPSSKSRKMLHNPTMLPEQAHVPRGPNAAAQRRLFVILEQACLEAYKVGTVTKGRNGREGEAKYALLNCDDHQGILAKTGRDIADARPDITHQCLLTLLDSPLNKAGLLQVYIHTAKNTLIEVNPHVRIPRTFKRFSGLMVQLLHKLQIRGVNGSEKLLKVIKNPVTDHLPPNTFKITLSGDAKTTRLSKYLPTIPATHNIAVFVGAMARGRDDFADHVVDEKISISDYPLSASVACGKFCCALEELWDIV